MNDRRVSEIRKALEAFIESVDATSRLARWGQEDPIPDSLRLAAAEAAAAMRAAVKLTVDKPFGTPAIVHRLSASTGAIRTLAAAYDEFLSQKGDSGNDLTLALENLDAAIDNANEILRGLN